nr:TetR family transcriptional regulator [Nocardia mangyaensis]
MEATLHVVARDGVAGVSHRAVAKEAGQPYTSAAYHFSSIHELLTAALTSSMDADAAAIRQVVDAADNDGRRDLAELLASVVRDPGRLLAEFELFLLAARDTGLRPATDRWLAALADFARRYTADPVRVRVFVGAIDGLLLQAMLTENPPGPDEFNDMLRVLLPE